MSVHVLSRFLKESESELGARLVGSVMAYVAGDDGICWAAQARLIGETKLSESAVRRAIRRLEELGELETRRAQRGQRRINVYRLWCGEPPEYDRLPFVLDEPFTDDRSNRPVATGHPDGYDRSLVTGRDRSSATSTPIVEKQEDRKRTWTVEGRRVTEPEEAFAREVLTGWNTLTEQRLAAKEWLAMIVRRHREAPELAVDAHLDVVRGNLGDPWWKGPPSPNVIWGSAAQFERAQVIAAGGADASAHRVSARERFDRLTGGAGGR